MIDRLVRMLQLTSWKSPNSSGKLVLPCSHPGITSWVMNRFIMLPKDQLVIASHKFCRRKPSLGFQRELGKLRDLHLPKRTIQSLSNPPKNVRCSETRDLFLEKYNIKQSWPVYLKVITGSKGGHLLDGNGIIYPLVIWVCPRTS